jgi:Glycosyl hydrolase family 65 central catalytic domain
MAAWVLCRALDLLEVIPSDQGEELRERLSLTAEETERWEDVSRKLRLVFHEDGILSQFEGYEDLEELDWEGYPLPLRGHQPARQDPGGRGRHSEPLQGLEAGGRAHALLPSLGRREFEGEGVTVASQTSRAAPISVGIGATATKLEGGSRLELRARAAAS